MPISASISAVEKSTFVVTAAFADEDGAAVTPSSITWRLESDSGATINSRSAVVVTSPAASINIVLSGDDLSLINQENDSEIRRLIIIAFYTSSLGAGLPLSDSYEFRVLNTNALRT
jgi:hypothetical protein